jgi:hypothetical protein
MTALPTLVPTFCIGLALLAASAVDVSAQSQSIPSSTQPDLVDQNGASPFPFMTGACRMQVFFAASEMPASTGVARTLHMRFDGPSASTAPSRHRVATFVVLLGVTNVGVDAVGSVFQQNLTTPLTTAFGPQAFDFDCDTIAQQGPHAWGGVSGGLSFPLAQPVPFAVPTGGSFVVDIVAAGNDNVGASAQLDYYLDPTATQNRGFAVTNGRGCPIGATSPGVVLDSLGSYEPGGSFSVHGDGYAPNAPVATVLTFGLLAQPFALPGTTPTCWVYVDPASATTLALQVADGAGRVPAFTDPSTVPLPRQPRLCGVVLYVQNAAPTPLFSGNSFGLATTNYRTIVVGCPPPANVPVRTIVHHVNSSGAVATTALPGAPVMRIDG